MKVEAPKAVSVVARQRVDAFLTKQKAKAMVVTGEGKRMTLSRIKAVDQYRPEWPATVIHEGSGGEILADQAASAG